MKRRTANFSAPLNSGMCGRLSWPTAVMTARARISVRPSSSSRMVTVHMPSSSSHCGGDDFGLPAHMVVQAVLGHQAGEVALQLGLFGEEVRPLVAGLEAVAVEVVGHVDARPGIAVLPPCSTRASVLLHDGERNVGLLQPNTGQDSRFAAADDDHRNLRGTVGVQWSRPARVDAPEVHLLGEQRPGSRRARFRRPPSPSFP